MQSRGTSATKVGKASLPDPAVGGNIEAGGALFREGHAEAASGGWGDTVRKGTWRAVSVVLQCATRKGIRLLLGGMLKYARSVDLIRQAGEGHHVNERRTGNSFQPLFQTTAQPTRTLAGAKPLISCGFVEIVVLALL